VGVAPSAENRRRRQPLRNSSGWSRSPPYVPFSVLFGERARRLGSPIRTKHDIEDEKENLVQIHQVSNQVEPSNRNCCTDTGRPNSLRCAARCNNVFVGGVQPGCLPGEFEPNFLFRLRYQCFVRNWRTPAAGSFTNSTLKGYVWRASRPNPINFGVVVFSGEFSADGATPTGNMTGAEESAPRADRFRAPPSRPLIL